MSDCEVCSKEVCIPASYAHCESVNCVCCVFFQEKQMLNYSSLIEVLTFVTTILLADIEAFIA